MSLSLIVFTFQDSINGQGYEPSPAAFTIQGSTKEVVMPTDSVNSMSVMSQEPVSASPQEAEAELLLAALRAAELARHQAPAATPQSVLVNAIAW